MLLMCWTQYVRKFGKFSNGHRTGKGQLSFQSQRKVMPKNVQTTVHHIPLPHTENFQVFWNLEKAEEPEVKLPTSVGSKERQRHSWKTSTSAALTAINPLTTRCGKFLKRWEYQTTLPGSWETCMQIKKKQLEWDMEQWFQIGKGVHWGCILSPCLFKLYPPPQKKLYARYIMQNAGLEESQAGNKVSGRNINSIRYEDDTILMIENEEEQRASWGWQKRRVKRLA